LGQRRIAEGRPPDRHDDPEQYGGQGKGWLDAVLAIEALSAACAVTGRIAVETNMGAISAVMAYGSERAEEDGGRHGAGRR